MKFANSKQKIKSIVLATTLTTILGCMSGGSFTGKPTESRLLRKSSPKWYSEIEKERLRVSDYDIQQNLSKGNVRIRGNAEYSYDVTEWKTWKETFEIISYHIYGIVDRTVGDYNKKSPKVTEHRKETPSLLEVYAHGVFEKLIPVSNDGSFEIEIASPKLKRPQRRKYWQRSYYEIPVRVSATSDDPKKPTKRSISSTKIGKIKTNYSFKPDDKRIKKFVDKKINSRIFPITIYTEDRASRMPVSSKISIRCINSPDIESQLRREFRDGELFGHARKYTRRFLAEDQTDVDRGQSNSFNAIEDARYEIETRDPNYHFFRTVFTASKDSRKKHVLLVDIGDKIRIDPTKEGQGLFIER